MIALMVSRWTTPEWASTTIRSAGMDESPERRVPNAGSSPGGYLPRLRRAESEAGSASEPVSDETKSKEGVGAGKKKGKRRKKKLSKEPAGTTPKGVLLEETPALDTIEVRRK